MKVKFADRIYEVLFTKELAGLTMYAVEDEPNHIDWLINVEVVDAEKKELKKIEDEEYNGEDYGIDGLWHAMNILEETLGKVDGYQTDDGFLSHQCAITSVKKLYKQKPDWGEEDERIYQSIIDDTVQENQLDSKQIDWLKSIKSRVQPKQEWSKEDEKMLECALDMVEWYDGKYKEKSRKVSDWLKSLRPQNHWKPSEEQMNALSIAVKHRQTDDPDALKKLFEQLKKL